MIDLHLEAEGLNSAISRAKDRAIVIPTLAQMRDPAKIPDGVKQRLAKVGLWDVDPLNLFRITWHNAPQAHGGGFGSVNVIELPSSLTGTPARILAIVGRYFPTGAHKVGAAFGCLVPRLVTGQFDPVRQKAVWPSTGNYCRGGAYDSALLGTEAIAILPEGMSRERFEWLEQIAGEVIKTPGSESNVKEIFDKCWELKRSGQSLMIFNQFEELGNYLWHYHVTGAAMEEAIRTASGPKTRFFGMVSSTGSGGTIAAGDHLKQVFPGSKIAAAEALQCPTLLMNGFGAHRIEGIGDKHVPWIHNVRNTDVVVAIDDNAVVHTARLFNEPAGREHLATAGVDATTLDRLDLMGFSGIGNVLSAVKMAHHFELGPDDLILTVLTDSMELYGSRLDELREAHGAYTATTAAADHARWVLGQGIDNLLELGHRDRKRIHNLKYFTWIEQQERELEELNAQWSDPGYWSSVQGQAGEIDRLIEAFNARVAAA